MLYNQYFRLAMLFFILLSIYSHSFALSHDAALYLNAARMGSNGDNFGAKKCLEELVSNYSSYGSDFIEFAWTDLGACHEKESHLYEAIKCYNQAICISKNKRCKNLAKSRLKDCKAKLNNTFYVDGFKDFSFTHDDYYVLTPKKLIFNYLFLKNANDKIGSITVSPSGTIFKNRDYGKKYNSFTFTWAKASQLYSQNKIKAAIACLKATLEEIKQYSIDEKQKNNLISYLKNDILICKIALEGYNPSPFNKKINDENIVCSQSNFLLNTYFKFFNKFGNEDIEALSYFFKAKTSSKGFLKNFFAIQIANFGHNKINYEVYSKLQRKDKIFISAAGFIVGTDRNILETEMKDLFLKSLKMTKANLMKKWSMDIKEILFQDADDFWHYQEIPFQVHYIAAVTENN